MKDEVKRYCGQELHGFMFPDYDPAERRWVDGRDFDREREARVRTERALDYAIEIRDGYRKAGNELCAEKDAEIAKLLAELDRVQIELTEHKQLFDIRSKADMRAINGWREAHPGNDLTWTDHADLVPWLLDELDREREARVRAERQREEAVAYAEDREQHAALVARGGQLILKQRDELRTFVAALMDATDWPRGVALDCRDFQDLCVKHGILIEFEMKEPCNESCQCAEVCGDWPVTCYRPVEWLRPLLTVLYVCAPNRSGATTVPTISSHSGGKPDSPPGTVTGACERHKAVTLAGSECPQQAAPAFERAPKNPGQVGECRECHAAYYREEDIGMVCEVQYCRGRIVAIAAKNA